MHKKSLLNTFVKKIIETSQEQIGVIEYVDTVMHAVVNKFNRNLKFAPIITITYNDAFIKDNNVSDAFFDKYDIDTHFKQYVQTSVIRNIGWRHVELVNTIILRDFLEPKLTTACNTYDILMLLYKPRYMWYKIDARKLMNIVAIAENIDELLVLLQMSGIKI